MFLTGFFGWLGLNAANNKKTIRLIFCHFTR
jgi:hypothetical protein